MIIYYDKIGNFHNYLINYLEFHGNLIISSPITYCLPYHSITLRIHYCYGRKFYVDATGSKRKIDKFEEIIQKESRKFKRSIENISTTTPT